MVATDLATIFYIHKNRNPQLKIPNDIQFCTYLSLNTTPLDNHCT